MNSIRLSIGSWAHCFGPYKDRPVPFDDVIKRLGELGFDGVELGGFPPHPNPIELDTKAKRAELEQTVADHGLAADLWSFPVIPERTTHAGWQRSSATSNSKPILESTAFASIA